MSLFGDFLNPPPYSLTEEELKARSLLDRIRLIPDWENSVTYQQYATVGLEMARKRSAGESTETEFASLKALAPAVEAELKAATDPGKPQ